ITVDGAIIYVCAAWRSAGELDNAIDPGAILAAAIAQAAAGTEVDVRPMRCLGNCSRGASAALRANGSWTYLFGGLDATCAEALVESARLLARAADGNLPSRARPEPPKRGQMSQHARLRLPGTGE